MSSNDNANDLSGDQIANSIQQMINMQKQRSPHRSPNGTHRVLIDHQQRRLQQQQNYFMSMGVAIQGLLAYHVSCFSLCMS